MAIGDQHTVAIAPDGALWTWGLNYHGEGGAGTTTYQPTPLQIGMATSWKSISTTGLHTLAIRQDGSLWAWGRNGQGELGTGSIVANTNYPAQVQPGTTWLSVSAGAAYSLAIRQDGTLWAWGNNFAGQLGTGTNPEAWLASPVQVGTATTWRQVSAGRFNHTLAVRTDGTLWAWGANTDGQLGTGTTTNQLSPVQIESATTWQSVSAGYSHSLAVRTDGTLWAWGANHNNELGAARLVASCCPSR